MWTSYSSRMCDGAKPETPLACDDGTLLRPGQPPNHSGAAEPRSKSQDHGIITAATITVAALAGSMLASCSDPIGRAEDRRRSVYDRGGTNREVCNEARKVKAAYVDAQRHDEIAWLAVDVHCTGVDGPSGDAIAKQHGDAVMAHGR